MSFVLNEMVWGQRFLDPGEAGLIGQNGFLADYDLNGEAIQMYIDCVLTVQGTIATDENAILTLQGGTILIGSSGSIIAGGNAIVANSGGGPRIANAGLLQSGEATVVFTSGQFEGSGTITNSGEISSLLSTAVYSYDMLSTFTTNHGLIHGAIAGIETLDDQTVRITNTGTIQDGQTAITLGGNLGAIISNGGVIDGTVLLGNGADLYHGRNGEQSVVYGRSGNDRIQGGGADEELYGDIGSGTLSGNGGEDVLNGGTDSDRLNGGRGDDELTGGSASDVFVFGRGHGHDRILDFVDGRDTLDLSAFHFANAAAVAALASNRGGGLLINLAGEGGGTIFIDGFSLAQFGASGMILA